MHIKLFSLTESLIRSLCALTWSQSCEVSLDLPGLGSEGWGWAAGAAHHPWSGSEEPKWADQGAQDAGTG